MTSTPTLADCLERRSNTLAAVRILAATAVLWAHAWVVSERSTQADFFHVFAFTLDWHGVHAFFILSGMLLARSYMRRPDALRFVVARFARYMPGIFASTAIAAFVVGPIATRLPLGEYFGSGAPFGFVALVTTLTDVNATLPQALDRAAQPDTLYVPLWTIHYELVFALCLAVAGWLGLIGRRRLTLAALVATCAVNVAWFWNGQGYPELGSPHHLVRFATTFGLGIAMATFADRIPVSRRLLLAAALVAAPLAFTPIAALAGMLLIGYAIVCIGFTRLPFMEALAKLGVWSYGFYVSGFLIEQCVVALFPNWNGWAIFVVSFVVASVAGATSWRYIEQPSMRSVVPITRWIRDWFPGKGSSAEPVEAAPERRL